MEKPSSESTSAAKPRTIAEEIEEYQNMPPDTRKLIHKLVSALIDTGKPVVIE